MIQKLLYLRNCWSDLLQNSTQYTLGCALPLGGIIFMAMMSQGAYGCMKHTPGMFSGRKAKIDTTWSVPKCFLDVQSCITVIQWYFPSFDGVKQCSKKTRVPSEAVVLCTNGCHHDVLCSCVNDDSSRLILEHNSLLNAKLIYMFALWYPDDMC